LQYAKTKGEGLGNPYHVIRDMPDLTDSRCNSLFTTLRDGCGISGATPNTAVFLLHEVIASLLGIFTLVTQQLLWVMALSTVSVAICWCVSIIHS